MEIVKETLSRHYVLISTTINFDLLMYDIIKKRTFLGTPQKSPALSRLELILRRLLYGIVYVFFSI